MFSAWTFGLHLHTKAITITTHLERQLLQALEGVCGSILGTPRSTNRPIGEASCCLLRHL